MKTCQANYQYNNCVYFQGFFKKREISQNNKGKVREENNNFSLNADDMILSYKLADVLHRLDNKSLIVIGNVNSLFFKNFVKRELVNENSFINTPKDIKEVYVLQKETSDPIIIAKDYDNKFKLYGLANNLNKPKKNSSLDYSYKNTAEYGDTIESCNKFRFKLIKSNKEANSILYDAKYPVESFLTEDNFLSNGLVRSQPSPQVTPHITSQMSPIKSKYGHQFPPRTFSDIAGMDKTIKKVKREILFPLLHPEAFEQSLNKGSIFYGPPGTGKTLLALALAGEFKKRSNKDVHLVYIKSKDLDRSKFGETEALWRSVFEECKSNQPAILFIDEIDSIVETRQEGSNYIPNNSVVSQFLTAIDDLEKNDSQVYIIGTTNRPDRIDPAIKRKGRLGNLVEISLPDEKGCLEILNLYLKNKNVSKDFNREDFASKLYNDKFSGADIATLVNEARDKMYERCGIYTKMENGTYTSNILKDLQYSADDFENALKT